MDGDEGGGLRLKNRKVIYLAVFIVILLCLTLFVTAVAGDKLHWMMIGFYTLSGILMLFAILFLMMEINCFEKRIYIPSIRKKATASISVIETKDGTPRSTSEIPYEVGDGVSGIPGELSDDSFDSSSSESDHEGGMTFSVTIDKAKDYPLKSDDAVQQE